MSLCQFMLTKLLVCAVLVLSTVKSFILPICLKSAKRQRCKKQTATKKWKGKIPRKKPKKKFVQQQYLQQSMKPPHKMVKEKHLKIITKPLNG